MKSELSVIPHKYKKYYNYLKSIKRIDIFFIIIFLTISIIAPILYITSIALWCDEAAYIVIGEQIKNGSVMYRDIADVKTPGTYYIAALIITIAGKSMIAPRIFTAIIHAGSALLVFFLGVKIKNKKVGMIASILFLIAVYIPIFQSFYYLAEPIAVFFTILSVLFFLKENFRNKFLSGIFLGIAVLFKQTTLLLFGIFFLYYILRLRFDNNRTKEYIVNSIRILTVISIGIGIPLVLIFLYFLIMGAANDIVYYTILFLSDYKIDWKLTQLIHGFYSYLPIWILFFSMTLITIYNFIKRKSLDDKNLFLVLWALILLYPAIVIVFSQRVLFAVPPISLLSAILLYKIFKNLKNKQMSLQIKSQIIISILITTCIAAGYNITIYSYSVENINIKNQMKALNEIEQYVDGDIYIFPADWALYYFSNLTPGVKYMGSVFSEEMANQVINGFESNNIDYIVGRREYITEIEEKKIKASNPNHIIYNYIQTHYDILTTTNSSIIYRLK